MNPQDLASIIMNPQDPDTLWFCHTENEGPFNYTVIGSQAGSPHFSIIKPKGSNQVMFNEHKGEEEWEKFASLDLIAGAKLNVGLALIGGQEKSLDEWLSLNPTGPKFV